MYSGSARDSEVRRSDSDGGAMTADINDDAPMPHAPSEASPKDFLPLDELRMRLLAPPARPLVFEQLDLTDRAEQRPRTILAQGMSKVAQLFCNRYLPIATRIREAFGLQQARPDMTE
jgi:hypothetical protein